MDKLKSFLVRHFEQTLVLVILVTAILGTFVMEDKTLLLNFYFLPVVFASYYLGKRLGVLSAFLSILAIIICALPITQRASLSPWNSRGISLRTSASPASSMTSAK